MTEVTEVPTEQEKGGSALPMVSVVMPVTHADVAVEDLVEGYAGPLRRAGYPYEVVVVLDGVGSRITERLQVLAERLPVKIVVLHGSGLGEGIALSAGVEHAVGEFILNVPQYMQAEPEDLPKVIQALGSGNDFVATWRNPRVDPWLNRLQSSIFNKVMRVLMGNRFRDLNSGVRGMRRSVLDDISLYGEMYRFLPVLAQRKGFKVVEVKVRHREERGRHGFYGIGVYIRRALDILSIAFLTRFTQQPLRFFGMLGLLAITIGVAVSVHPLWMRVFGPETAAKPILVLGIVLVAFGVQLIGFGLVGEIIIFTNAKALREYQVEEVLSDRSGADAPEDDSDRNVAAARDQSGNGTEAQIAEIVVRELLPGEDGRWDRFVEEQRGTFFHLSGWRKTVEDVFRHQSCYLVAERGAQWVGVLPLFKTASPFLGRNLISTPYAVYGGVLTTDDEAAGQLLQVAMREGQQYKASYVELRQLNVLDPELPTSNLYQTYRKTLPEDIEQVLASIPKKARAEVRRARDRFELVFEVSDDLEAFYRLFCENKRRLGSPSLPMRWFRALRDEFGQSCVIHMVKSPAGEPLAAVMSFCMGDTVYAYYSGAVHEEQKTGMNNFIYCKIMEWCVQRGYAVFDFGRSRRDSGPAAFKKNMGFEAQALHYQYCLLRDGARLPEFNPSNPKLRMPRRMWSHLPNFVARGLSGPLSKYLP